MEPFTAGLDVRIASRDDLNLVRELALLIFPVTYRDIVAAGQVDYMMNLIYSPEALAVQQESGQIFLIIYVEGRAAGFAGYTRLNVSGDFKLNKIYLDYNFQGRGLGKWLLSDVISRVKASGGRTLQLNVNRFNKARGFYESMGFTFLKEDKVDIGNGYFMDDYVLSLRLKTNLKI
jgi:ribosomal protein S18 acetylase RimI-like enzyme